MKYCVLLDSLSNQAKPIQRFRNTGLLETAYQLMNCKTVQLLPVYPGRLPKGYGAVTDEEARIREGIKLFNPLASWLYGCDDHGAPILNNAVIFKVKGNDFAWMTEEEAGKICEDLNDRADEIFDLTMFATMGIRK